MADTLVFLVYIGAFGFALVLAAIAMDWVDSR